MEFINNDLVDNIINELQDIIENHEDCPICMMEITNEHITTCKHKFCKSCLDIWLENHNNCPMCRKVIKEFSTSSNVSSNSSSNIFNHASNYYNIVQPHSNTISASSSGINTYSFALTPENHQPSGTVNLSRIDTLNLDNTFNLSLDNSNTLNMYVFARSYNFMRISSGMGGLYYSN